MDAATFLKKTKTPEPVSEQESSVKDLPNDDGKSNIVTFRDTTPSGLVVEYCPGDGAKAKRWYAVNGTRVPSVTTVLDCLSKPGLSWWGMKVGVEGVLELLQRGKIGTKIEWQDNKQEFVEINDDDNSISPVTSEALVALLTAQKLTVNHVLGKAADRGTNVHSALEAWAMSGGEFFPTPQNFPEEERPYVEALLDWLQCGIDGVGGGITPALCEVMVGSEEHGFAGRYDLVIKVDEPLTFVQKKYKRKESVMVDVAPGRYLVDLKSSKGVYPTSHFRQLAAYELASVECGYPKTDGQFVLHVTSEGFYEFVPSTATPEDFLAVLEVYKSDGRLK